MGFCRSMFAPGDEAQALIDRLGTDRAAGEQAARGLKARKGAKS